MLETQHVRDFNGALIPRSSARKIDGKYYQEGVTCIKMSDDVWYRTTTDKIRYDWESKTWVFTRDATNLVKGLVDDGTLGYFTASDENVALYYKKEAFVRQVRLSIFDQAEAIEEGRTQKTWIKSICRRGEIAEKFGFTESIFDGIFYKTSDMTNDEKAHATTPGTPQKERSQTYSLDDDPATRKTMEERYNNYMPKVSPGVRKIAKLIPFSFGLEFESSVGHIPARLRGKLGVRPLRDGSIAGIEYVTIPLEGSKGINTIKELCTELTKRCQTTNACSVHVHYGNTRRDKIYILSLYRLAMLVQKELLGYFPFTRTNSIRPDGKVYCKPLEPQDINAANLFKNTDKESFQKAVNSEFNKIYGWLNNRHLPGEEYDRRRIQETKVMEMGGRQVKAWRLVDKVYCYSTKSKVHSVRGNKWDRPQRYFWLNMLPTFFGPETIEARPHEATFNYEKVIMCMLTFAAILDYANNTKLCLTTKSVTLKEILNAYLPSKAAEHIMDYYTTRAKLFKNANGSWKENWQTAEDCWLKRDKNYKFNSISIEELV